MQSKEKIVFQTFDKKNTLSRCEQRKKCTQTYDKKRETKVHLEENKV